ncbi:MAG: hypothetical protein C0627_00430 [Sulfurimonas sp.]|nr:MAG: hypothetical protein C0627_00430 [Sulfurimonas sp.]
MRKLSNVDELPKFDLIAIHGIYSWIDEKNQSIINDFIDKHLSSKGIVYISYNTKPGTDAFRPAQHIIKEVVEQLTSHIENTDDKIKATLNWMEKFHTTDPAYLNAFATIKKRIDTFKGKDVNYIYHEYLNDNWFSFYFSEMAKNLTPAGLKYLGQSQYSDDLEVLNYTNEQIEVYKELPTPLKQDVQDSMTNTQFRKDLWMRDANAMSSEIKQEFIKNQQVILSVPYELVSLEIKGKRLKINLSKEFYQVVVDLLADYQPKTIESLKQELNFSDAQIIEIITVLNSIGMVALIAENKNCEANQEKCDAFNKIVLEEAAQQHNLKQLASPVIAEAIVMHNLVITMMIKAYKEGITTQKDLGQYVVKHYIKKGFGLRKSDGGVAASETELTKEMKSRAKVFINTWLPFFKAHKIL